MNTHDELDRIIRDWLDDRVAEPRQAGLDSVLDRTTSTPQHRRRWLERWLPSGTSATRRGRARDDPPDNDDSRRNRIMISATGIVGTIVVLALGATLVLPVDRVPTPMGPGAGTGDTHVVAQDGSGDFATITEAVEAAVDGDVIAVKPGTYVEAVTIAKDITLAGDGPRDQVVIENPPDGPMADRDALRDDSGTAPHFALLVEDADATISGLTVSGPRTGGVTAIVIGGAPTLDDVSVVLEGPSGTYQVWAALYILGGSRAHVVGSELHGYVSIEDGSSPTIEESEIAGQVYVDDAVDVLLRGDSFAAGPSGYSGVIFGAGSTGTFERNDLTAGALEIKEGSDVEVRDNTVGGSGIRIVDEGTVASISGNSVSSNLTGIDVRAGATATIGANSITGSAAGLTLGSDAVTVEGNTISGARTGIVVVGEATPTITGNTLCDNETHLHVDEGNPTTLDGNEVCPEAAPTDPSA